jgi:hypothetical protein
MPADPRLDQALKIAARVSRLRAAASWEVERVEAGLADMEEGEEFILTLHLRFTADSEDSPRVGFRQSGEGE